MTTIVARQVLALLMMIAAGSSHGAQPKPSPPPKPCVPPQEAPGKDLFKGWLHPNMDVALFKGVLQGPGSIAGQWVTEGRPGSGSNTVDSCWFPGSVVPKYTDATSTSGFSWRIQPSLHYGPDQVGYSWKLNTYYGQHGRTPCRMKTTQHIKFICPDGTLKTVRDIAIEIDVTSNGTTVTRNGVSSGIH
jgi:hypothetical protein